MAESTPEGGAGMEWSKEAPIPDLLTQWKQMEKSADDADPDDELFWKCFTDLGEFLAQRKHQFPEGVHPHVLGVTYKHLEKRQGRRIKKGEKAVLKDVGRWSFHGEKPTFVPDKQDSVREEIAVVVAQPEPAKKPAPPKPPKDGKTEEKILKKREALKEKRWKGFMKAVHDIAEERGIDLEEFPFIKKTCAAIKEAETPEVIVEMMHAFFLWVRTHSEETDYEELSFMAEKILLVLAIRGVITNEQAECLEQVLETLPTQAPLRGSPDDLS